MLACLAELEFDMQQSISAQWLARAIRRAMRFGIKVYCNVGLSTFRVADVQAGETRLTVYHATPASYDASVPVLWVREPECDDCMGWPVVDGIRPNTGAWDNLVLQVQDFLEATR